MPPQAGSNVTVRWLTYGTPEHWIHGLTQKDIIMGHCCDGIAKSIRIREEEPDHTLKKQVMISTKPYLETQQKKVNTEADKKVGRVGLNMETKHNKTETKAGAPKQPLRHTMHLSSTDKQSILDWALKAL